MRLELSKRQYDAMVDAMTAEGGYKLTCDPHEGSTYQKGPDRLCQADGAYWLDLELGPQVPEVMPSVWLAMENYADDHAADEQASNNTVKEKHFRAIAYFCRLARLDQHG